MSKFMSSAAICAVVTFVLTAGVAVGQTVEERYGTVSVVGEGIARTAPDKAVVRFGIVTRHENPEEARRLNAEAARQAMNEVRELIDDERRLRLESLRLQPAREYDPDQRRYIERGYEAVRDVVVEVLDLEQLPTIVARVVQGGANRLNNVTYELENRDVVRNLAIERALLNAREKARLMASTLGQSVGRVLRISEQGMSMPFPIMRDAAAEGFAMAKAEPEPEAYAPGEIEVRASVEVMFALRGMED